MDFGNFQEVTDLGNEFKLLGRAITTFETPGGRLVQMSVAVPDGIWLNVPTAHFDRIELSNDVLKRLLTTRKDIVQRRLTELGVDMTGPDVPAE